MHEQKGFILPLTLLILTLITILILSQIQILAMDNKALNQLEASEQGLYQLETIAAQLAYRTDWPLSVDCISSEKDPNEVIQLLEKQQGCSLTKDKLLYRYWIEELGVFPCLQVSSEKGIYSTEHRRITVLANSQNNNLVQLRLANPVALEVCKEPYSVQIKPGLISWRELVSIGPKANT